MKIAVSELIVRYLERLGIDHIFGMPGAHILPVYDSLFDSGIRTILAKHEQGAAFMAGGFARASERISACITTAGPGATNLVTGVANAFADKQPLIIITGEAPTHIFGKGGLQESSGEGGAIDQSSLFKGITRYHKIIERTDYIGQVLNRATNILTSDNAGPVLLSIPYNVQKELVEEEVLEQIAFGAHRRGRRQQSEAVAHAAELLSQAKNPVIIAGYGCLRAGAQAEVSELSEMLGIAVTTSLKAKGVIDEQSDLSLGSLGVTSGGHAYNYITETADLVMVLGAGFNERTSYVWDKVLLNGRKIIQVDSDPGQLEKVFKADIAIQGDIRETLSGVLQQLSESGVVDVAAKGERIAEAKSGNGSALLSGFPLVKHFFVQLEKHFPAGAQFFDDNIIFAQNFLKVSSANRYYPNSGVSSLGHAIPAAIGARLAEQKTTFAILGDGGFQMCCMELMTAVNYDLPLNVVLFNNATMGLIRKNQHQQYDQRFISCDFINPDYEQLARSFGIGYLKVSTEAEVDRMFADADLSTGINLIEIPIDKDTFPNYLSKR